MKEEHQEFINYCLCVVLGVIVVLVIFGASIVVSEISKGLASLRGG